jgi:hypothetical protein
VLEPGSLLLHRADDVRVAVAGGHDPDAPRQVEPLVPVGIDERSATAGRHRDFSGEHADPARHDGATTGDQLFRAAGRYDVI